VAVTTGRRDAAPSGFCDQTFRQPEVEKPLLGPRAEQADQTPGGCQPHLSALRRVNRQFVPSPENQHLKGGTTFARTSNSMFISVFQSILKNYPHK
jgi:hypothetical protein